jgi:hypothetical protein
LTLLSIRAVLFSEVARFIVKAGLLAFPSFQQPSHFVTTKQWQTKAEKGFLRNGSVSLGVFVG